MTLPSSSFDPTYRIYLTLAQYPLLRRRIRSKMRQELSKRGILSTEALEELVSQQAADSQLREGISDSVSEEADEDWKLRLDLVREHLTDLHFANNLPYEVFEDLVKEVLAEHGAESEDLQRTFNPELAPQEALFEQAKAIARLPAKERAKYEAREREIKVVLIRSMISDQLAYINVAKEWFTLDDLLSIRRHKIGKGKVGGKAAGMLLALRILQRTADKDLAQHVTIPESYFLGADVMYAFMAHNGMIHWADQKYKEVDQIRDEHPTIQKEYAAGSFPADIKAELAQLLERVGSAPIIVRSSSLLEDNFGSSFAGKYASYFCPNQGTPEGNLDACLRAIAAVYASGLNPDALLYRRAHGLQDYDERLAVLIQVVQGEPYGRYYFPHLAGVAFSRNLFRWSPKLRSEDGFLRLVAGMGTRAVEHVGNDYPRLVALSHPELRATADVNALLTYSQHQIDVVDLEENSFKTLPMEDVLDNGYPHLRLLASLYKEGDLRPIRSTLGDEDGALVLTLDGALRSTPLAERMRRILKLLEKHYKSPVDMEFTVQLQPAKGNKTDIKLFILQCRPQSQMHEESVQLPDRLDKKQVILSTEKMAPHGKVIDIRYVLFVPPEAYYSLPRVEDRHALTRAIGRLNNILKGETFICVGPGRWGTVNPELGVSVSYADIYNTRALIEVSGKGVGPAPEPSYGTHFFQDLIESHIFPLAVHLDDKGSVFNREFFYDSPNRLATWLPELGGMQDTLRLIAVGEVAPGHVMELIMDSEANRSVAFLKPEDQDA
ncbi:MAG TPA: PEP/pyruvate-binding domain-containing protein [Anaerolineales bacterium]|nr:PEP/pyruvate-binding domain-containing protein [Anaerolineales bacterium]